MPRDFIMKGLAHVQVLRICLSGGLILIDGIEDAELIFNKLNEKNSAV